MPIRLKVVRRKEEQISKVKGLMEMFNVNATSRYSNSYYQYQPIGASSTSTAIDTKIENTRNLFEMFHLAR